MGTLPTWLSALLLLLWTAAAQSPAIDVAGIAADPTPHGPTMSGTPADCNRWFTIKKGDTCYDLEKAFGLTPQQFQQWNPAVSRDCLVNFWPGYAYCVGVGPVAIPTSADTAPPAPTMTGIAANCNRWYTAQKGDNCYAVEKAFGLTPQQFQQWNPAVSHDCLVNFWPGYAYCVGVGPVAIPTSADTAPHAPTMTGIAANCNRWYTAQKGDYCYAVEKAFGLTPQQFQQWNPAVSLDCLVNFWPGYAYCVGVGPAANGPHGPTMPGIAPNCLQFYTAKKGDTCYAVEKAFGITPQQFQQWNPAVSQDCLVNFWADYAYCVGVGPVAPTSTSTVTATATSASTTTSSTTLTTSTTSTTVLPTSTISTTWTTGTSTTSTTFLPTSTTASTWTTGTSTTSTSLSPTTVFTTFTTTLTLTTTLTSNGQTTVIVTTTVTTTVSPSTTLGTSTTLTTALPPSGTSSTTTSTSSVPTTSTSSASTTLTTSTTLSTPKPSTTSNPPTSTPSTSRTSTTLTSQSTPVTPTTPRTSTSTIPRSPSITPTPSSRPPISPFPSTMVTTNVTYSTRNPITSYNQTITPIDTAWPPTKTHPGQPKDCDKWYLVAPGDTCRSIYQRHGNSITMDELLEWNPDLKADCDYPIAGYWVCVGIKRPALTIIYPTTNDTVPDPTPWTPRPTPTETSVYPPTKTQPGLAPSCSAFYEAQPSDTCDQILASNPMLKFPLLLEWNPALKADCSGILPGYSYCIAAYNDTNRPSPPTVTTQPYPLKPGTAKNCTAWYKKDDGDTCDLIVEMFGTFDKAQFVAWNPDIGVHCYGLENGYYYCVADPSTPKTRTRPVITAMSFPTARPRRQPGVTKDCIKWWLVSIHDDCYDIMHFNGITMADLYTWNPALSGKRNCLEGLVPDTEVCVGVSSSSSTTDTAAPSSTAPGASFSTGLVTVIGGRD
ncbi:lysM domain-containing protein [Aspergillus tubingensis]|uniref:lysM domain-containing protein n=1 Tax=Aspergillus tubingensis TaxID=5068 RepID=UPI00157894C4|nr:lysM domain-containing protein [Aspergillus tubingensis]GFN12178.1 lysM domain-containing protein [Aspergillus tubingensis]